MHYCTLTERTDWIDFQAATEGTGEEEAGEMGRKLDLSGLSEAEAQHVLKVVQRDMKLREKEEARLSEMKQELDEEGSRSTLLSRQPRFNERCCIRCCAPFTFLFHPKRTCLDCTFNVCKDCCAYSQKEKAWLCNACQKTRLLKTQSLEWYYNNVRRRFKRFGSAKVLKTLYRKHAAEQGNLAELTEESTYAESTCNEGSVCESDSAFHKQIEEHNMADTITVALRVAEEAIEEAITKAEAYTDSQEKQKEAQYLRDNRDELIEELATTIVHKIIRRRRDLSELQPDYSMEWPVESDSELLTATSPLGPSTFINAASLKSSLWRSRSAFALHTDGNPEPRESKDDNPAQPPLHTLKKEGTPIQPSWKSVDRLDNSSASAVLQSQDGNWIALQSSQLSRPSLLTKRKSLVFSVLEKESGVVSAYDEMGSDTEPEPDGAWGAALLEFRRKMNIKENTGDRDEDDVDDDDGYGDRKDDDDNSKSGSDTDPADFGLEGVSKLGLDGAKLRYNKPLRSMLKREAAQETLRPTTSRRASIIDMNFNPGVGDSSEAEETPSATPTRTRKRRRSRREHQDDTSQQSPYTTSLTECSTLPLDDLVRMRNMKQEAFNQMDTITSDTATPDLLSSGHTTPEPFRSDPKDTLYTPQKTGKPMNQVLATRLQELASKVPDLSSTEDELDRRSSKLHRKSCSDEMEAHETMWDMEVDDGDSGRAGRVLRHPGRRGDSRLSSMDAGSMDETRDDDGDAHTRAVRAKAMELDTQMKIGEKVEMEIKSRQMSVSSVEQTWWETLGSLGSDGSKGERSYEPLSDLEHSATYDGLDAGSGIDDILTDMVRASEKEIEKSAEDWEIAEDLTEAMDVGEDKAEDTGRATDEVERNTHKQTRGTFPESWNVAMTGKQKGREGSEEVKTGVEAEKNVECQTESYTQGGQRAQMGKAKKTAERGTVYPSAEHGEEKSKRGEASTKSYTGMRGQEKAEGDSKMYGGVWQTEAGRRLSVSERRLSIEESHKREVAKALAEQPASQKAHRMPGFPTSWAAKAQFNWPKLGSRKSRQEEEKMEVKETQQSRGEEKSPPRDSPEEKVAGEKGREETKMAIVSEKVTSDVDGGARRLLEESSSASDSNLYPSPDDINKKYSAASLRSVTTEMLRVLNATEQLIQGAEGSTQEPAPPAQRPASAISPTQTRKLDQQLSKLEENVYVAASSVYSLEGDLSDLEACARRIGQSTSERELAHLEDQVASAAAQVQQSELQVTDIAARIAALKTAGLNVAPKSPTRTAPKPSYRPQTITIDASRNQRRRLPAPPTKDKNTPDI